VYIFVIYLFVICGPIHVVRFVEYLFLKSKDKIRRTRVACCRCYCHV